jgi:hypothetical protein
LGAGSLQHGADGLERVSFQTIVDEDEGLAIRGLFTFRNEGCARLARLLVDFLRVWS